MVSEEKMFKECGRRRRRTTDDDGRRTTEAYLSYKLTKWAFGSGELKMYKIRLQRDFFETCNKWVMW